MYFILLVCALLSPALAYYENSDVVELTVSNFDKLVIQSDEVWVVKFYAPWNKHSYWLVPEYTKLATVLKGIVKVGAINNDEQKQLIDQYGIRSFPTIKIFGANKGSPIDYKDQRTAQAIADAALVECKNKVLAALKSLTPRPHPPTSNDL